MKFLSEILYKSRIEQVHGSTNIAIENITADSRLKLPFAAFVAIKGTQSDGHDYIDMAIQNGAVAIICENLPEELNVKVTYVKVQSSSESLGYLASNFFDNPSEKLKIVGVTGTNGKTTTVTLLHKLFRKLGKKTGLLSTIINKINDQEKKATHTTPDPVSLQEILAEMVKEECEFVFMEVSSHAVDQNRTKGIQFAGMVFTNISHDHLDYHGSFKEYIKAKRKAFIDLDKNAFALTNTDDNNGEVMVQSTKAQVFTYALKSMADFKAKIIDNQFSGLHLFIDQQELYAKLIGQFNAYNLLTVYAIATILDQDKLEVLTILSTLDSVDGRFQYIKTPKSVTAIVDYAHTPDALENVLKTISEIRTKTENVITLVGCGGDRDKTKRPEMARIAVSQSDKVILTSDNPRSEEPDEILNDMKKGLDPTSLAKTLTISDRREAIKLACSLAQDGDIILVAGKGHEKYQEIKGEKHPFDDLEIVNETLKMLEK